MIGPGIQSNIGKLELRWFLAKLELKLLARRIKRRFVYRPAACARKGRR